MSLAVHLEGTTLEGGGQLLRIGIGVSALTAIPIEITNIRGNRSGGGGLKAQHLSSVIWLGRTSEADISGAGLKSKKLYFAPSTKRAISLPDHRERELSDGTTIIETQISQSTPGSIGLVFQAILPYLLWSGSSLSPPEEASKPIRLKISGGTNTSMSPSHEYISQVLLPTLTRIGLPLISTNLHSRGWTNGRQQIGSVSFTIPPLPRTTTLAPFTLSNRGAIVSITATVLAPKACETHFRNELSTHLSKRQASIFDTGGGDPAVTIDFEDSRHEKRFYLLVVATSSNGYKLGRDWLYDQRIGAGKIDVVIAKLVKQVVGELAKEIEHGGCVDEYMRDQLVVFQALAKGKTFIDGGRLKDGSAIQPSLHARTAEWVVNEILGVEFDGKGGCEGIGLAAGEVFAERQHESAEERNGEKDLVAGVERLDI